MKTPWRLVFDHHDKDKVYSFTISMEGKEKALKPIYYAKIDKKIYGAGYSDEEAMMHAAMKIFKDTGAFLREVVPPNDFTKDEIIDIFQQRSSGAVHGLDTELHKKLEDELKKWSKKYPQACTCVFKDRLEFQVETAQRDSRVARAFDTLLIRLKKTIHYSIEGKYHDYLSEIWEDTLKNVAD